MFTSPESWSTCLSLFCSVLTVSVQRVRSYSSLLFGLKVQHRAGLIGRVSEYLVRTQLGDWLAYWLILQLGKKTQRHIFFLAASILPSWLASDRFLSSGDYIWPDSTSCIQLGEGQSNWGEECLVLDGRPVNWVILSSYRLSRRMQLICRLHSPLVEL